MHTVGNATVCGIVARAPASLSLMMHWIMHFTMHRDAYGSRPGVASMSWRLYYVCTAAFLHVLEEGVEYGCTTVG